MAAARPALLANHAQHLTVFASDSEDVLRIELENDDLDPSWCPRFSLDVTVNGQRAELAEDSFVVAGGRGPSKGTNYKCVLPVFGTLSRWATK